MRGESNASHEWAQVRPPYFEDSDEILGDPVFTVLYLNERYLDLDKDLSEAEMALSMAWCLRVENVHAELFKLSCSSSSKRHDKW